MRCEYNAQNCFKMSNVYISLKGEYCFYQIFKKENVHNKFCEHLRKIANKIENIRGKAMGLTIYKTNQNTKISCHSPLLGGEGWVGWEGNMCFFCYKDLIFQLDASDLSSSSTCQNIKESELHLNPILYVLYKLIQHILKVKFHKFVVFKGTGTRDLIWLKVVSLDRS